MNNVRLCFGTLASVLNIFRNPEKTQLDFISDLIGLVDENSVYIVNGPSITKLLKYKINFVLSKKASKPSYGKLAKNIDDNIASNIEDDGKKLIILALLDIIRNDESLERENKERFEFYFASYKDDLLKERSKFQFSDFVGNALLYTIDENVKNIYDDNTAPVIDKEYIIDVTSPYLNDIEWDVDNQVLILTYIDDYKRFISLINKYKFTDFLFHVDPKNGFSGDWIDKYFKLREDGSQEEYKVRNKGEIEKKILLFCNLLEKYITFLTFNMSIKTLEKTIYTPDNSIKIEKSNYYFSEKLHEIFCRKVIKSTDVLIPPFDNFDYFYYDATNIRIKLTNYYGDIIKYAMPHLSTEKKDVK